MGFIKKMKDKKVAKMMLDKLFLTIRLKGYRKGEPRVNHKKQVKGWLDGKVHKNGASVMIQYLPTNIVETEDMSLADRKIMKVAKDREGFVTQVSQSLARVLIVNGEAKLVGI